MARTSAAVVPRLDQANAWLSAINRGPDALSAHLAQHGLDYHGHDGLGVLTWIQNQHEKRPRFALSMLDVALASGVDPNGPATASISPLLQALMRGHDHVARHLLSAGANPNHGGAIGAPVLPLEPVIDRLLLGRNDANTINQAREIAEAMFEAGADPNGVRRSGKPLLEPLIRELSETPMPRAIAMTRFLDVFWNAGHQWFSRWDEDLEDVVRWKHLPLHARQVIAQRETDRLELATAPSPTTMPRSGPRL